MHELWLSETAWPQFPKQQQAAPSSECQPAHQRASDPMEEGGNGASGAPDAVLNGLCGGMEGGPPGEVRDMTQEQAGMQGARAPAENLFALRFVLSMRPCTSACVCVCVCVCVSARTHTPDSEGWGGACRAVSYCVREHELVWEGMCHGVGAYR